MKIRRHCAAAHVQQSAKLYIVIAIQQVHKVLCGICQKAHSAKVDSCNWNIPAADKGDCLQIGAVSAQRDKQPHIIWELICRGKECGIGKSNACPAQAIIKSAVAEELRGASLP